MVYFMLCYNFQYEILFCIQDLDDSASYKFIKVSLLATSNPDDFENREHGFIMMDVFFLWIYCFIYIDSQYPLFVFTIQPKDRPFTMEPVSATLLHELISSSTFHSYLTARWEMEKYWSKEEISGKVYG